MKGSDLTTQEQTDPVTGPRVLRLGRDHRSLGERAPCSRKWKGGLQNLVAWVQIPLPPLPSSGGTLDSYRTFCAALVTVPPLHQPSFKGDYMLSQQGSALKSA